MKRRHVLAVLGLSFITLGIYMIYWLYKTRKELLQYLPNKSAIPPVIILFIPVFVMIFALVVSFTAAVSEYSQGATSALATIQALSMIIFMISILACFIVSFWWFYKYFKAVEAVTQGNDAMLLYVVWIVLTLVGFGPIWVVVVQNDLNKFIDNGYRPLKTPVHPGYQAPPYQQPAYGQPMPPQHPGQWQPPAQAHPQPYGQYPAPPAPQHVPHHTEHHQQHPQQHQAGHHQQHPHDHDQQPPQHYQG